MASLTLNPNDDREEETVGIVEDKNDDDDDDVPQLSANALAALQEFLQERQAQLEEEEEEAGTTAVTALQLDDQTQQLRHVSEDWQLSQFWYVHVPCVYEKKFFCTWSFPKMFPLPDPCLHQVHRVNGYRVSERGVGSCG